MHNRIQHRKINSSMASLDSWTSKIAAEVALKPENLISVNDDDENPIKLFIGDEIDLPNWPFPIKHEETYIIDARGWFCKRTGGMKAAFKRTSEFLINMTAFEIEWVENPEIYSYFAAPLSTTYAECMTNLVKVRYHLRSNDILTVHVLLSVYYYCLILAQRGEIDEYSKLSTRELGMKIGKALSGHSSINAKTYADILEEHDEPNGLVDILKNLLTSDKYPVNHEDIDEILKAIFNTITASKNSIDLDVLKTLIGVSGVWNGCSSSLYSTLSIAYPPAFAAIVVEILTNNFAAKSGLGQSITRSRRATKIESAYKAGMRSLLSQYT